MFPSPSFMAQRYFSKKVAPLIVCLPLFIDMLGSGIAQWYPIYLMDDTVDENLIYQRYNTIKMFGMLACLPAVLFYIPFQLWTPLINKEDIQQKKNNEELQLLQYNESTQEPISWIQGVFLTVTSIIPFSNWLMASAGNGIWTTFQTISNSTMIELGYSDKYAGVVSQIFVVQGTPYALYISYIMDTKKKLDKSMKIFSLLLLQVWSAIAFMKIFFKGNETIHENMQFTSSLILFYVAMGFTSLSYQGLALNSCCIVCSPMSEAYSNGNALLANNLWCIATQEQLNRNENLGQYVIIGIQLMFQIMHMTYYKTEPSMDQKKLAKYKIFKKNTKYIQSKNYNEGLSKVQCDEKID